MTLPLALELCVIMGLAIYVNHRQTVATVATLTHALVVFEDITLRKRSALLLANYNATLEQGV